MLIAVETRAAAAAAVCAQEEPKVPTQNLKNYQRMKAEEQEDNKGREGELEMVHLIHKEARKCEEVRVIPGIVLLCLIIGGNLAKLSK